MVQQGDDSLFDEAVNHAIRLQSNPGSASARDALAGWRARSDRHEQAWAEVAEIHGMAGSLMGLPSRRGPISRRKALGLALTGLGLGAGGALFGPGVILAARADHLTATGEMGGFDLADGSHVSLGPDSAIALDFTAGQRGLTLLSGMIWCSIAPGAVPFRLRHSQAVILSQAGDLGFSEEAGALSLALERGSAQIVSGRDAGTALVAGDWLELDDSGRVLRQMGLAASEATSWRQGVVVVEASPLSVVVARIARWIPGRVVIAGQGLGARLVSGVFDMERPREALLAAVSPHGAGLRQISPWLTVVTDF